MRTLLALSAALLLLSGCPEDEPAPTPTPDATADATPDGTADGTSDATPDATPDAPGPDATPDATPDTPGPDATPDATPDAPGPDADATGDAPGPDATPDATGDTDGGPTSCSSACDCDQGFDCVGGTCQLGLTPVFCCTNAGCTADEACINADGTAGICGVNTAAEFGQVIFNEILADGEVDGDPNGDGDSADAVGDEFVEIVNTGSAAVDMSGWTLVDSGLTLPRHTFGAGSSLAAGAAMVVFGGGTAPDDTATATFVVANAADPGFSFGLSLDNAGDTISLLDGSGALVAIFAYGDGTGQAAVSDESFARDPDLTGGFTNHSAATGANGALFSPGTRNDGTSF